MIVLACEQVSLGKQRSADYALHPFKDQPACHISGLQARPQLQAAAAPSAAAITPPALGTYKVTWQASDPSQDGYPLAAAGTPTHLPAGVLSACAKILQSAQQMARNIPSKGQQAGLILDTKGARPTLGPVLSHSLPVSPGLASLMKTLALENPSLHLDTRDESPLQQTAVEGIAIFASSESTRSGVPKLRDGVFGKSTEASVQHLAVLEACRSNDSAGAASHNGQVADDALGGAGFQLMPMPRGALDSLRPTAVDITEIQDGCHLMQVQAAGLNFRDVLNCLGAYPGDPGGIAEPTLAKADSKALFLCERPRELMQHAASCACVLLAWAQHTCLASKQPHAMS